MRLGIALSVSIAALLGGAGTSAAQDDVMDMETAAYYVDLFCDMVGSEPVENQDDMMRAVGEIGLRYRPRPMGRQTPEHERYLATRARELYDQTRDLYARLELTWDGEKVAYRRKPDVIELARELPRPVLVELTNRTNGPIRINAIFGDVGPGARRPTNVPGGETRAELAMLTVSDTGANEAHLGVMAGREPFNLIVPISVSEPARLTGTIIDADTDKPFPGRVYVEGSDGHFRHALAFADNQTVSEKQMLNLPVGRRRNYSLRFSYSDGHFEILVPPGRAEVTLERGFEHEIVTEAIDLEPGGTHEITVASGRFIDMRRKGWYSGDTHVHWAKNWWDENEDMELLAIVQRAEDVRVANNLTLRHHNPPKAEFIAPTQYSMGPIKEYSYGGYHAVMGEEYRNQPFYGHLIFLNLTRLIRPISTGEGIMGPGAFDYPTNRSRILRLRRRGGISIEAHGLAGESPANVVDGLVDSMDQINPQDYYRVLDAGFRLPLTNGSDHPARLLGCVRCYVKVDGNFTYEKWIQGIRDCRTFTTSGPLLFLDVNGKDIGEEVHLDRGDTMRIKAKARTRHPIESFQVVCNGEVLAEVPVPGDEEEIELEIPAEESCWVVARCSSIDNYNALYGPGIAHTSAVYVIVDDKPIFKPDAARSLAEQLRRNLDNTAANARFGNDAQRDEALGVMEAAVEAYERLIEQHAADAD